MVRNGAVAFMEDGQLLVANLDGVATAVALPEQFKVTFASWD